jgi:hypothetical protein
MRGAPAVTALLVAVTVTGCGYAQPDLFEVQRSGADPNANVNLVVNDGGTVTCNKGKQLVLPGPELLTARDLARRLEQQATLAIDLPPARNSTLRYRVITPSGTVAFSDTSSGRPRSFDRLVQFSKDVIEGVCKINR